MSARNNSLALNTYNICINREVLFTCQMLALTLLSSTGNKSCVAVSDSGPLQTSLFCKMTNQIIIAIPNIVGEMETGSKEHMSALCQI